MERGSGHHILAETLSHFGGPMVRWNAMGVAVVALLIRGRRASATFLAVAVSGVGLINTTVKYVVARRRPRRIPGIVQAGGYSFPSGHSNGTMVFAGALTYLFWHITGLRRLALLVCALATVFTGLVGYSRVVLRHHHLGDVLAGYGVGTLWLLVVLRAFLRPLRRELAQHRNDRRV